MFLLISLAERAQSLFEVFLECVDMTRVVSIVTLIPKAALDVLFPPDYIITIKKTVKIFYIDKFFGFHLMATDWIVITRLVTTFMKSQFKTSQ